MARKSKRSIKATLISMSVIPTMLLGIILTVISANALYKGVTDEIGSSLSVAAHSVYNTYSLIAPGNLRMEDGVLKKGAVVIGEDYSIVDALKESYDMEISLFYGDTRVLTTLQDENGERLVDRKGPQDALRWVLEGGREYFSKKVMIEGETYLGYYVPIKNADETIVGMAFAGKKKSDVMETVRTVMFQSVAVSFMVILAALLICVVASQRIVEAIHSIMDFLGHIANSDFSAKMPLGVLRRRDEIGDMGHYADKVSRSLRDMITTDPLTGLYNRRASRNYLEKWIDKCTRKQEDQITVAIGDIDFFKKINDTYGHDCGDTVLVKISEIFRQSIGENGIVSRWGGEEFLLVFERPAEEAAEQLNSILEKIRGMDFTYGDKQFHVTLTFGLNGAIVGNTFDDIIKVADECLYEGKKNGRDRIVMADGNVILPQ